ncbi:hypothetical protein DPMN_036464 [Dreissena polymorpha]|uniref:DDE-1 domain-containing protein n=1 Tax=Dreissena polymorpha TaxID=45954 RepID=A0A9D4MBK3_DREPO|nr:hypothetical protein DPMN_036464 [Dreissena polymorpha]
MYCLLEHSSHIMQPLDLRLFAVLKQKWKDAVREFQVENIGEFFTKRTFATVFMSAWEKSTTIEVALKGFMEAGLFQLNPERVAKSVKLAASSMFSKHIQRSGTEASAEASVAHLTAENSAPDTLNRNPIASLSSAVTSVDASVPTMTTVNVPTTALDHAASPVTEIPETASVGSSSTRVHVTLPSQVLLFKQTQTSSKWPRVSILQTSEISHSSSFQQ